MSRDATGSRDLPPPSPRLDPVDPALQAAVAAAMNEADLSDNALAWLEKIRRFSALYGRRLGRVARRRFGSGAGQHLLWMGDVLLQGAWRHPERGSAPVDAACLSAALYCRTALADQGELGRRCDDAAAELALWLTEKAPQTSVRPALGAMLQVDPARWAREASSCQPLVLISPNPFSLFSVATLELCLRLGLPVRAILLRRFTVGRFTEELRRDGPSLLAKRIWRKLILRADENADDADVSLKDLVDGLAPSHRDIRRTAFEHGIPVIAAAEFAEAREAIGKTGAALGLFTGGGLIPPPVLGCFETGIVNIHMGRLPQYKGMDVVEGPILEGRLNDVGLTAHLMANRLDAGPVLARYDLPLGPYSTLGAARNAISAVMPLLLVDAVLGVMSGRLAPVDQPDAGRQYYFVHPALRDLMDQALRAHHGRPSDGSAGPRHLVDAIRDDPILGIMRHR